MTMQQVQLNRVRLFLLIFAFALPAILLILYVATAPPSAETLLNQGRALFDTWKRDGKADEHALARTIEGLRRIPESDPLHDTAEQAAKVLAPIHQQAVEQAKARRASEERQRAQQREAEARRRADTDLRISACVRAERAVRERLRAPSTAEFPGCYRYDTRTNAERTRITVSGYVEAKNALGVMLRNRFTVVLVRDASASLGLRIEYVTLN